MKKILILLIVFNQSLFSFAQDKQLLTNRMKECFVKADSIKKNDSLKKIDREEYNSMLCNCIIGSYINDFKFSTIHGDTISLYSFTKPIFVFLFASFCKPCMAEIPAINYLYKKYSNNVEFIGFTCDNKNSLQKYQEKYTPNIILVPSPEDKITSSWLYRIFSVKSKSLPIPTVYFINKDKNIIDIHVGAEEKFNPKQYGITDSKVKAITKEEADSTNIATLEPILQKLIKNK